MIRIAKAVSVSFLCCSLRSPSAGWRGTGDLARDRERSQRQSGQQRDCHGQRSSQKGFVRGSTSDGVGGYSVRLLPPGTYTVTVDAPGFATQRRPPSRLRSVRWPSCL